MPTDTDTTLLHVLKHGIKIGDWDSVFHVRIRVVVRKPHSKIPSASNAPFEKDNERHFPQRPVFN